MKKKLRSFLSILDSMQWAKKPSHAFVLLTWSAAEFLQMFVILIFSLISGFHKPASYSSINWEEQIRHLKQLSFTLCSILIMLLLSTPMHSFGSWIILQTCITPFFTFNFRSCGLQINYQLLLAAHSWQYNAIQESRHFFAQFVHCVEGLYCKRQVQCQILTPTPSPPSECVPLRLWCGGRIHSLGGEGEGSIVGRRQTLLCTLFM